MKTHTNEPGRADGQLPHNVSNEDFKAVRIHL